MVRWMSGWSGGCPDGQVDVWMVRWMPVAHVAGDLASVLLRPLPPLWPTPSDYIP